LSPRTCSGGGFSPLARLVYGGCFSLSAFSLFSTLFGRYTLSEIPEAVKPPLVPPVGRSGRGLTSQYSLVPDLLCSAYVLTTRAPQSLPSSSSVPSTVFSGRNAHWSPARGMHSPGVFLPSAARVCYGRIFCRFWLWPRTYGVLPLLRLSCLRRM
jgi:hypothetical protein